MRGGGEEGERLKRLLTNLHDQEPGHWQVSLLDAVMEGRLPGLAVLYVDVCLHLHQLLHDICGATPCCQVEGGLACEGERERDG